MQDAEKTRSLVTVVFNSLIYILSQSFVARTMPFSVAALSFVKRRLFQYSKLTNMVHIVFHKNNIIIYKNIVCVWERFIIYYLYDIDYSIQLLGEAEYHLTNYGDQGG